MEKYEKPNLRLILNDDEDIITTSGLTDGGFGDGKTPTGPWDS